MGQRFQSVFILPSVKMGECNGEPNSNNRSEEVIIFHNQWLYGKGALNINLQIMQRLKKAIKDRKNLSYLNNTKQDYINHQLERDLRNAVKFVSVQELHNEVRFTDYESGFVYSEEEKKPKKDQWSLSKALNYQDNNNGFFICKIQENLNIEYCFISGLEDMEEHEYKTPKEYLKLFYSKEDLIKQGDLENVEKMFEEFKEFKQTPKEDFKKIILEMNK